MLEINRKLVFWRGSQTFIQSSQERVMGHYAHSLIIFWLHVPAMFWRQTLKPIKIPQLHDVVIYE